MVKIHSGLDYRSPPLTSKHLSFMQESESIYKIEELSELIKQGWVIS